MRFFPMLVFVFGGLLLNCSEKQPAETKTTLSIQTARVTQAEFYHTYTGYGTITAWQTRDLVARFDGVIHLTLRKNAFYKSGDVIYSLSGPDIQQKRMDLQVNLQAAVVQVGVLQKKYERGKALQKQNLLSAENWQQLQAELALAKQSLQKAKSDWDFFKKMTQYRAPYDGILTDLAISQGDYVQAGTRVAKFLSASPVKLIARYFGDQALLRRNRSLRILLNDSLRTTGRIVYKSEAVSSTTGGHSIWIELDSLKRGLFPETVVKFQLQFDPRRAPAVPEGALVREESRYFVVVQKKGVFKNQPVTIGRQNGTLRELLKGPPLGTRVVTTGVFEYFYRNLGKKMGVKD